MRSVQLTGDVLKGDLLELQNRYNDLIHSTRGLGTILAFDVKTPKLTDELILRLRNKGTLLSFYFYKLFDTILDVEFFYFLKWRASSKNNELVFALIIPFYFRNTVREMWATRDCN